MYKVQYVTHFHEILSTVWYTFFAWRGGITMKYLLALVGTLLCTSQSGFAISQYEIEQKPNQYQLAYSSDTERMYIDLSSIHTKQTAANYKTVQARLLSLYTRNNVIADFDTNFTFYKQQPNAQITMTAWKVSKPTYYAQNGYPIDTLPQQRLAKDYGQHVATQNSPSQRIGEFVYNTSVEMEKISYTYDNPYIPPRVFPPVVNHSVHTPLFGLMPPMDLVISTPMDRVIPAPPAPPTKIQPSLQPGHVGGPGVGGFNNRGGFSPNFAAMQQAKPQNSNRNMSRPEMQAPPSQKGPTDNKVRDGKARNDTGRNNTGRDKGLPNNGGRNGGNSGNGSRGGGGQGPH